MENVRRTQASELPPLKTRELWAYGIGDVYGGGTFFIIGLLYLFFMTDVVGLSPAWAGLIFIIGKLWDAVLDPVMGYLSDHTSSRLGRRRLYFLAGGIPGGLAFALLWLPFTHQTPWLTFAYYLMAFLFFTTTFTILMVPYTALGAEIHPDYRQRNRLTTVRILCSQLSVLVAGVVPKLIIKQFENPATGHLAMGILFGFIYILPWFVVFFGVRERPVSGLKKHQTPGDFFRGFGSVFRNRSFRIHIAMYLCAYTAVDLLMALIQYYMKYVMNREGALTLCLGALLLAQIVSLPFYLRMANLQGKGVAYVTGLSLWLLAMLPVGILPPTTPTWTLVLLCALLGSGLSAAIMIPWAILPSLGDVDELITGEKRVGLYSGVMTFVRKLVQAGALYALSLCLEWSGYVANQTQSESTQTALRALFVLGPGALLVCGIFAGFRLRINASTHSILLSELERLRAGGEPKDACPETRKVCEELTGVSFDSLYPVGR